MKKSLSLFLILFFTLISNTNIFAQEYAFKDYSWDENPTIEIPEQYKDKNEVILNRIIKVEIVSTKDGAVQYKLQHDKIYINSDDAIEKNNKIYIPFYNNENIIETKARVILKDGKIITLNKKDIKQETDEERGVNYNYFAVNGLQKGSIIEKIFIIEENPELDGKSYFLQDDLPIANIDFELIYPEHLVFKTKSYNGLQEPVIDTSKYEKKIALKINDLNVSALEDDEKQSNWLNNLKIFRYKLDANKYNGAKNLYNYKEFATNVYERLNPELDKKQLKTIEDFCKLIPKSENQNDQIWNIENKIKKTIVYNRYINSQNSFAEIIKSKQANQRDLLMLYLAVFKYFNIENNIVFTSDRFKIMFDKEFESYENLNNILFYFPSINQYITPTEIEYRLPLIPSELANNNGLFIKGKKFAGINMGIGEIKFIEILGADYTHDVMEITVDFTNDIENPMINSKITFGGYAALNFQPIKDFNTAEEYKNILKNISTNYTGSDENKNLVSQNDGTEYIGKKPFILDIEYEGKDLIQKAGNNYLFAVGKTIGNQMELYQETKRKLPVEINYPHSYDRKIKIILPKNTSIQNLDQFLMDFKTEVNGKTEAAFTSTYNQKENIITVENIEFYNIINYPLSSFESYQSVINAAADFNKIVIVLNK